VPIRNSTPTRWVPRGLTDSSDGTNSFPGAQTDLINLIPDPSTAGIYVPRPAAQRITDFTGANAPTGAGDMQAMLTVGDLEYGMVASTRNAGRDEPYCYDLVNNVFLPVAGITDANTPTTQPSAGDWTPPIMAQVASRVIVCHPGFPGGATKFGWFDVSGFSEVTLGNVHVSSTVIDGNPTILGVQPGMLITGPNIPANTEVASTANVVLTVTGVLSPGSVTVTALSSVAGIAVGQSVSSGTLIPDGTVVNAISTSPTVTTGNTHGTTVLDNLNPVAALGFGEGISDSAGNIPAGTTVVDIQNISIATSGNLNGTTTVVVQSGSGLVSGMFVFATPSTAFAAGTTISTVTPFSLSTSGDFTTGSSVVTNLGSTVGVAAGMVANSVVLTTAPPAFVLSVDSPTQVTLSQAVNGTVTGAQIIFTGATLVMSHAATITATFVPLSFGSQTVVMSQAATGSTVGDTITFTTTTVNLSAVPLVTAATGATITFVGATINMTQAATGSTDQATLTITGGTLAAPLWGAGDCDRNPLPSVPLAVVMFNARAYFALGVNGIVFSDAGTPCRVSNQPNVQALTTNDGTAITMIAPLELTATLTGGIVQAVIAFSADGAMRQITGDMAANNLAMNLLPVATGTLAPLSVIPCILGTAFISPQGLRFIRPDGSVTDPIGADGQGVTHPFQYAMYPSRICAEANVSVLRITVQHGSDPLQPFQEYWFDLSRKTFSGPHSFPARLIQHWRSTFVLAPIGVPASLWRSNSVGPAYAMGTASDFVENGNPLAWVGETVLLPDNAHMAMNAMVEAALTCAAAPGDTIQVVAINEQGSALDGVLLQPTIVNAALRERSLHWHEPIVYKQMSMQIRGASNSKVRIGNLYMKHEILGYQNDEAALNTTYLRVIPLTGDTLTAVAGLQAFRIDPAGELATLTVVLPPFPADGDPFCISTTQTIDALTITAPGGATMAGTSGGPYVLAANGGSCWQFDLALNEWLPAL
jgi:hypothetical protein